MDWFRMYHEFASDAKVQSMSEAMQRRLMMLFCLRCSNTLVTLQDDELAFALRISEDDLVATKELFMRKEFIGDDWEILQWDKRQFVSDSSAPRVKKHRAKAKAHAAKVPDLAPSDAPKHECNVTLTPQIQNRTDTEQNRTEAETEPKAKSSASGSRLPADWKPSQADVEYCKTQRPDLLPSMVATNFYDYWISKAGAGGRKTDWSATWRMWVRKESATTAGRPAGAVLDLDAARKASNDEAKRRLFGNKSEVIDG